MSTWPVRQVTLNKRKILKMVVRWVRWVNPSGDESAKKNTQTSYWASWRAENDLDWTSRASTPSSKVNLHVQSMPSVRPSETHKNVVLTYSVFTFGIFLYEEQQCLPWSLGYFRASLMPFLFQPSLILLSKSSYWSVKNCLAVKCQPSACLAARCWIPLIWSLFSYRSTCTKAPH